MRYFLVVISISLAACAGPKLPAPNSADVRYDGRDRAVQVMVSSLQPASAAALVANDGTRYPAAGISLVSGPHVLYNPPPSIGLGIGGFGFSGCCSAFGSGLGFDVPVGKPTPAEVSDQYIASALIPSPPDYATNWSQYHVEVSAVGQAMNFAAPHPASCTVQRPPSSMRAYREFGYPALNREFLPFSPPGFLRGDPSRCSATSRPRLAGL